MDTVHIIPQKMIYGGDCLGKIEGKNVFIEDAIPGELVEIQITENKKDYCRAQIVQILEPSVHRRTPPCPLYAQCGGCNMMHISDEMQTVFRRTVLKDVFARAGVPVQERHIICRTGKPFGYRSRFQLHDGGLIRRNGRGTVPIERCPVATEQIQSYLTETPPDSRPKGRACIFGDKRVQPSGGKQYVAGKGKDVLPVSRAHKSSPGQKKLGERIFSGTLPEETCRCTVSLSADTGDRRTTKNIHFDVRGFFQSNMEVFEQALGDICSQVAGKQILDMYCGCGVISSFMAANGAHIVMVEHNRDALVYAEENLSGCPHSSYGISGRVWAEKCSIAALQQDRMFDTVCIDPPRSGMEAEVCRWLCAHKPQRILSLSCNPSTHARDCAALTASGYTLKKLEMLDFYPQTSHIESFAILELS